MSPYFDYYNSGNNKSSKKSKNISRVIISTDNYEIATVAKDFGAEVPFMRPEHLATDASLAIDAYEYTINRLEANDGISINNFVVLQPTSPLRTCEDIDFAIELFKQKKAFSVISFCKEHHPISWHKYIDTDGKIASVFEDKLQNRQDVKPTYFPNGAIYVMNRKVFETRNYYSGNTYAFIMDRVNSVDIDTIEDFLFAEYLMLNHKFNRS